MFCTQELLNKRRAHGGLHLRPFLALIHEDLSQLCFFFMLCLIEALGLSTELEFSSLEHSVGAHLACPCWWISLGPWGLRWLERDVSLAFLSGALRIKSHGLCPWPHPCSTPTLGECGLIPEGPNGGEPFHSFSKVREQWKLGGVIQLLQVPMVGNRVE